MSGRISLLVDSPLRTVIAAMEDLDAETKKQINTATRKAAAPIWAETTRAMVQNRLQTRLADSARVGVTARNIFLRAGGTGRLSSGTPISVLAKAIEYGASPETTVATRSRKDRPYSRRMGNAFRLPRRGGYVANPAAREGAIARIASLWVQTTIRTTHEAFEKGAE